MAMIPVNIARVSQNLRSFNLLNTMRSNELALYRTQNQLSTGLKFVNPSEDPSGASAASIIDRHLDRIGQVQDNLTTVTSMLTESESAMDEAIEIVREARRIAIEAGGDTVSAEERASLATVVEAMIDEAIALGNRQYLDAYLFSGHDTADTPFVLGENGVLYNGDTGRRATIVDSDFSRETFTISGTEFFGAISTPIEGSVDLDPGITASTRVGDLRGSGGEVPSLGRVIVSDGANETVVDLSGCSTVGDILDKLNAEMPATLTAQLNGSALQITGAATITVTDSGGGETARNLGILAENPVNNIVGYDLNPVVTKRTTLDQLNNGAGVDLSGGITITNGNVSATLDFSGAETVEDVLNIINGSGTGAWAVISDDGGRIDILNRVSGSNLTVSENGGSAATSLGILTVSAETPLSELNLGRGVHTSEGADFRITTADGTELEIDIDGARTLQDVLDLINADGAVTATLATNGNGIVITDNTVGAGTLQAEAIDLSSVLSELGLDVSAAGGQLVGDDVHPVRVEGLFTTLLELKEGLETDDTSLLSFAGDRLERVAEHMELIRGQVASQSAAMESRVSRLESEQYAAEVLRSDICDVDITEAIVRFQQVQTALQANLSTASQVMNLSLFDYLR